MARTVYNPEMQQFIADNVVGIKNDDLAAMVNREFGTAITPEAIASYKCHKGLKSGLDFKRKKGDPPNRTSFKKGQTSHNKGKKGWHPAGCEKSWFEKGHKPKNWTPVGTERVRGCGHIWVKIAEPNKWRQKQILVWEAAYGPIPKGHKIIYKDRNKQNVTLENMMLVTDAQLSILNSSGMYTEHPELTEAGVGVAKLMDAINKANKKVSENNGEENKR